MTSNWTVYNILLVTKQSSRLGFTDSGSRNEKTWLHLLKDWKYKLLIMLLLCDHNMINHIYYLCSIV